MNDNGAEVSISRDCLLDSFVKRTKPSRKRMRHLTLQARLRLKAPAKTRAAGKVWKRRCQVGIYVGYAADVVSGNFGF